jgi:hypothetical protein
VASNVSQRGIDQSPPLPHEFHFTSSESEETTTAPSIGGYRFAEQYMHNAYGLQKGPNFPIRIVNPRFSCASIISDLSNRTLDNTSAKQLLESNNNNDNHHQPVMIEIAPGIEVALRGAEETQVAIDIGFYVTTQCWTCQANVSCILDCNYFVCPDCHSVSPNPVFSSHSTIHSFDKATSLGLGFHMNNGA